MSEQKPSVGRIVHYRLCEQEPTINGTDVHPAIITRVWSDTCVNLTVFPDAAEPFFKTSVLLCEGRGEKSRWFWPPRA